MPAVVAVGPLPAVQEAKDRALILKDLLLQVILRVLGDEQLLGTRRVDVDLFAVDQVKRVLG